LRVYQQSLVEELLPKIAAPAHGPVTAVSLFGDDRPLHFEIGFGGGEHMAERAVMFPDHGFIGCEPFLNGVAQALTHVHGDETGVPIPNIRIHHGDALELLARLPDESLDVVYLLHPDPWRKARHAKRRMMNPGPLDRIAAKLKPGGEFRFGTDHPIYIRWAMMQMNRRADFAWQIEDCRDFQVRPDDWPETRYERKARTVYGHEVWYFRYIRV
jgi:tRNA (guanine-N7-)-methyltransferase